jgi:hypothetical protein
MSSRQTGLPQQSHNYHSLNEMVTISFFVFHVIYLLLTKNTIYLYGGFNYYFCTLFKTTSIWSPN